MEITQKELTELRSLAKEYGSVKKMLEYMEVHLEDPKAQYYREILEMTKYLATELRAVREGKLEDAPIMTSDTRTYERVMLMVNGSEKTWGAINKGSANEDKSNESTQEYVLRE